jgi:hypothetical protein
VGAIRNVSHATWSVVRISIGVTNTAGVRLGTLVRATTDLKPGADWRFKIAVPQKNAATVEVVDIVVSSGPPLTPAHKEP